MSNACMLLLTDFVSLRDGRLRCRVRICEGRFDGECERLVANFSHLFRGWVRGVNFAEWSKKWH
jgi:hypothetical protein